MKFLLIFTTAYITFFTSYSQSVFYYKVKIHDSLSPGVEQCYLKYSIDTIEVVDTIKINGKQSFFKKDIPYPVEATFSTNVKKIVPKKLFLANNTINISLLKSIEIQDASGLQETYKMLTENDGVRPQYFPLYATLNENKDSIGLQKLSVIFDSLRLNDIEKAKGFVYNNPRSYLSIFALMRYAGFENDLMQIENKLLQLPGWAINSPDGKTLSNRIEGAKKASNGKSAPVFSQPDKNGAVYNLSQFKGRYILIDFWASWCGPCRKEHPALIKLYETFKTKNFELISISLDDNKSSWINAIKTDRLQWVQLADLKGFKNSAALQFGVQVIPANFLINPEGIIVAKNMSIEALQSLLNKCL